MYSDASRRATNNYFRKHIYRVSLNFPKDLKEKIAISSGEESVTRYIMNLVYKDMINKGIIDKIP